MTVVLWSLCFCSACGAPTTGMTMMEAGTQQPEFPRRSGDFEVLSGSVTLKVHASGPTSGANLILIHHGGPGLGHDMVQDLERFVPRTWTVVTYDQRGSGQSSVPAETSDYQLSFFVADVEAIRVALGVEKLHLFGHSWGSVVVMAYAAQYPQRVASLSTFGGVPPTYTGTQAGFRRSSVRFVDYQARGIIPNPLPAVQADSCLEEMKAYLPLYFFDPFFDSSVIRLTTCRDSPGTRTWTAIKGFDLTAPLASFAGPVQVLFGEADNFGVEWATLSAAAFETTRPQPVILERCGHFWHECEAAYAAAWTPFLEKSALPE